MSLNHTLATSAFSNVTTLGGRLESPKFGNLTVSSGLNLSTPAAAKTAAYTATTNDYLIPVNTAGGAVVVTLPAAAAVPAPVNGFSLVVLDSGGSASSNNITISAGAGTTLVGPAGAGTISANRSSQKFIYYNTVYYQLV